MTGRRSGEYAFNVAPNHQTTHYRCFFSVTVTNVNPIWNPSLDCTTSDTGRQPGYSKICQLTQALKSNFNNWHTPIIRCQFSSEGNNARDSKSIKPSMWRQGGKDGACVGSIPQGTSSTSTASTAPPSMLLDPESLKRLQEYFQGIFNDKPRLQKFLHAGGCEAQYWLDTMQQVSVSLPICPSVLVLVDLSNPSSLIALISLHPYGPQFTLLWSTCRRTLDSIHNASLFRT